MQRTDATTRTTRRGAVSAIAGALCLTAAALTAAPAAAQNENCRNTGSFDRWMAEFKAEARASGISERTISASLNGIAFAPDIVQKDRRQSVFSQSFLEFAGRMVARYRLDHGRNNLKKYAKTFAAIERQWGVPGPVIAAFWGLETDFGANTGDSPVLRSLATLAYDCRRPELFREHLMDALRIVERGDLAPSEMIGAWAGELGQTQFMASDYYHRAVDFDGDGKVNLIKSTPDALASAGKLLSTFGWRRGEPWLEEVRVTRDLNWDQADLSIKHARKDWAAAGITRRDGGALTADALPASLLLPMGRNGPAFLAYPNFDIYLEWNQSYVYCLTAAYFATRLAGAPPVSKGRAAVQHLSVGQIKDLQTRLSRQGYDVGGVDGTIGEKTRAAVKAVQLKLGLPADSYPTAELLQRLR